MKENTDVNEQSFKLENLDLSQMSIEQLTELKNAIIAQANKKIGPEGFNPIMMATQDAFDSYTWSTLPWSTLPWENLFRSINMAVRRISLALTTAGLGITASSFCGSQGNSTYAPLALAAAGISAVWFVVDMMRKGGPTPEN
jgi:hypothetical protein